MDNCEMTYSIVAKIPETKEIGIAVASRFFAFGSLVPCMTQDIVIASQAFVHPLWGLRSISMLKEGIAFKRHSQSLNPKMKADTRVSFMVFLRMVRSFSTLDQNALTGQGM